MFETLRGGRESMKRNFIKKENPRQLLAAPPPPPCPVLFWSPVVVKESTDQWWVFFLMFSTEEAWWFGALEAKLNHHYPQKNPDCCLHQSYRLGSSCSLQLDLAVLRALPFWQVVLRGASLPPVTLGWDVGTAAGGGGQQTLLWHGEDGEGWGNRGIVWGFL